jgi:hypothetical protein
LRWRADAGRIHLGLSSAQEGERIILLIASAMSRKLI